MSKESFYVTTPIYYPSGKPHVGHFYTSLAADVLARWNRILGKEVFFQTGVDEHGQKIKESAEKAKKSPQSYVDEITGLFSNITKDFKLSTDYFLRTTDEKHKKVVQEMLQKTYDKGDIYKAEYNGLYCVGCERYYTKTELVEEINCPLHKTPCKEVKEENYFFRLSKYEKKLLKYYKNNSEFISPQSKQKEIINRVKEGLQDISISRQKKVLDWGVELPFDSEHVTYVWFDALLNYFSSTRFLKGKEKFWPANVHLIGHDISWFHTVYWPAMLMSFDEKLPHKIFSHGLILDAKGHKMSKSLGNVVDPYECMKHYGLEEFRFYLLSAGGFGDDIRFSYEHFIEKINNELNNDLGNLVSRVHAMTGKYCNGKIPSKVLLLDSEKKLIQKLNMKETFGKEMNELKFNQALEVLFGAIRDVNAYVNEVEPWKEKDQKRLDSIMNTLCSSLALIATYLEPFMPETTQRIRKQFNFDDNAVFTFESLKARSLGEKDNLFSKVKKEEEEKEKQEVKLKKEGFESLCLKVGEIKEVKDHPEAEKLFMETIDLGEDKPRQILSGLKDYYTKEELLGKKVIVVANLKPAKMRGEVSEGMLLASENEKGEVGVVMSDAEIGTMLECEEKKADNIEQIKVDSFFKVKLESKGDKILHEGKEVKAKGESLSVDRGVIGDVR